MNHGLYRLLKKLRVQRAFNWTASIPASSKALAVPLFDALGAEALGDLSGRSWKQDFFARLRSLLRETSIVDVGANLGQTLLQCVRAEALPASYLAFEPNPLCAGYLAKLVEKNELVACAKKALLTECHAVREMEVGPPKPACRSRL
jgi:hypothetical protein